MTEQGYHSTSGINLPKTDQAVTPKINGLESYEWKFRKQKLSMLVSSLRWRLLGGDNTSTIFWRQTFFMWLALWKLLEKWLAGRAKVSESPGVIRKNISPYFRFNENHVFIGLAENKQFRQKQMEDKQRLHMKYYGFEYDRLSELSFAGLLIPLFNTNAIF